MTPERWEKVRDVLGQVLELVPAERPQFLNDACADDASLRSEVESLLSSDENARSSFLQSPSIPSAALTKGTRLGDYEIISLAGSGGMGEVYRARDTKLKREVAIKVLPAYWSRDPERLERFELEARAAAALNHPNITSIFHVGQHDGSPYIVTELLQGETLRERLRKGPLRLREALDFGVEIARGLGAAHDAGVIHRDLKPENIFVSKDGRIKILDFGLAKLQVPKSAKPEDPTVIPRQTNPGQVLGTVGYMSPEQVRVHSTDARSDIFAAGAVLYEMLTGKPAFRKATSAETMSAILNEDPPAISHVAPNLPPGLQRIVNRCLAKNQEQRFQHASDVAFALEALTDSATSTPSGAHPQESGNPNRVRIAFAGTMVVLVLSTAVLAYFWARPEPVPKVSNYVQLTHDGQPKRLVGSDGSRIYLGLGLYGAQGIAQISISGGDPTRILSPYSDPYPADLSPDGSKLLVIDSQGVQGRGPLWSLPVLGGVPRRLGDTEGIDASWSPDGKTLAFSDNSEMFLANADGTESRKLFTMKSPGGISAPVWSPDGSHFRFEVSESFDSPSFLWEVAVDGTGLRRLLPGWNKPPEDECCGRWTADGKYFVFRSRRQIWALPRKGGFLRSEPKPVQLTFSPMLLASPLPSKDGKKLFVVGRTFRGELMRYDSKTRQFVPFLGGISAEYLAFSKDGEWVAYVSYPEGTLWRSKADGSERLQLTYPSNYALMPRWSPDSKKIVFAALDPQKPPRIFEVSPEGGSPRLLIPDDSSPQSDPNWSPDGDRIVFAGAAFDPASTIRVVDLNTHQIETLPGAQGFFSPRWSPNGRYVVAHSTDSRTLLLFDFQTQKWTELAKGFFGWENWSKDGEYIYVLDSTVVGTTNALLKIRLSDHKIERMVVLNNFVSTGHYGTALSLAPDDSPLLLREAGTQDVYALDWEEP